jgi:Sulfotransferase family
MSTVTTSQQPVRPTFLFIGADRCGSKSLHNFCRQHPECYVPPIADPLFFDKNYERGLDWYLKLFAKIPETAKAIGEFSHNYIHNPEAARRIALHFPNIKLLATLRHPIERAFSSYASAHSAGLIRGSFEQAVAESPMLINDSLYADNLRIYFDLFPREQIRVLLFDDLEADPRSFAAQAFDFLDLPLIDEIDYEKRMSVLSRSRFPLSGPLSKQGALALRKLGWVNLLGKLKSNHRFRSIFYRPYAPQDKPRVDPDTRQRLGEVFAPQIDALEKMLGRDLAAWRS